MLITKIRKTRAVHDIAGEARYASPEVVSCGVPPQERAASTGRGGERRVRIGTPLTRRGNLCNRAVRGGPVGGMGEAAALLSAWRKPDCLYWRFQTLGSSPRTPAFLLHDAGTVPDTLPPGMLAAVQPAWTHGRRALFSTTAGSTKGAFVQWLASSNFSRAWYLEDDAVFTGDWSVLFDRHMGSTSDLLGFVDTSNVNNYWYTHGCTICEPTPGLVHWPVIRMSRRLAQEIIRLAEKGEQGHGEVFASAACTRGAAPRWCTIEQLEWDRVMIPNRQTRKECCRLPRRPARDALYHPIKCDAAGAGVGGARRKAAIDVWTWKGLLPHRIVPTAQGRLNLSAMDADRVPPG
jgi:hypothetical protein